MKILITGGAGYIGTPLTAALAAMEEVTEIVIYDNLSRQNYNVFLGRPTHNGHKVKFIEGEILDSRQLKRALEGVDVVYHLAAKVTTPFANTDPHFYEQVNHWGTAELTYAIEESDVRKLIYTSSVGVYGGTTDVVTEDKTPNPRTFYGISKMRGEEHVRRLTDKLETVILRCGNVYGYNKSMRFDAVINKFAFEAKFNNRITIHGNGKQSRAFLHIDQAVHTLKSLALQQVPGGVYNLVDKNLQILEIVDVLKDMVPDMEFIFINQHLNLRNIRVDESTRLRQLITLLPQRTLKEEIDEFFQNFSI